MSAKVTMLNTGLALLLRLRRAGIYLSVDSGQVKLRLAPKARLTSAVKELINKNCRALVAAMLREQTAQGCWPESMNTYDEMMGLLDDYDLNREAKAHATRKVLDEQREGINNALRALHPLPPLRLVCSNGERK